MPARHSHADSAATRARLVGAVDIADVAGGYVTLQPAGRNLAGHCPIRPDEEPMFFVLPTLQTFHCLGCGAHGDALDFLMQAEKMGEREALQKLQQMSDSRFLLKTSATPPGLDSGDPEMRKLLDVLQEAAAFYKRRLKESPAAIEYLKSRGVTGETAAKFTIGYAPDSWDGVVTALRRHGGEAITQAGLAVARETNGHYDRFRNRVMFPIRTGDGAIVGFGGRVLGDDEPKYLNSPETPVFHKGVELYGLHEALQEDAAGARLLVVEGYMDVIMLAQHGIPNCVGTMGTATTGEQISQLLDATAEVIFCFDGDYAGQLAAWRALEQAMPVLRPGREIRFVFLPEGEDPDSFVRAHGKEAMLSLLGQAQPLAHFLTEELAKRHDVTSLDGRARFLDNGADLLRRVMDPAWRQVLVSAVADRAGVSAATVSALTNERPAPTVTAPVRGAGSRMGS